MRIVAGEFKGRRLAGPPSAATRPTSDKVREALFSTLGPVDGLNVLDLFAGTGALGLESLSRGAGTAVFVESDRRAIDAIETNLESVGLLRDDRAAVRRGDAIKFLEGAVRDGESFDLVFLDPPYSKAAKLGPRLAELLPSVVRPGGRIVTESDRRQSLELVDPTQSAVQHALTRQFERVYGDTLIRVFAVS